MIQKGRDGEEAAVAYLLSQGCQIIERNFHCRYGEIDIIGRDQNYLIIVEVKNRRSNQKGHPAEAVNFRKQRKIMQTFTYYRMIHRISEDVPVRFDVLACYNESQFEWIKNAFEFLE